MTVEIQVNNWKIFRVNDQETGSCKKNEGNRGALLYGHKIRSLRLPPTSWSETRYPPIWTVDSWLRSLSYFRALALIDACHTCKKNWHTLTHVDIKRHWHIRYWVLYYTQGILCLVCTASPPVASPSAGNWLCWHSDCQCGTLHTSCICRPINSTWVDSESRWKVCSVR